MDRYTVTKLGYWTKSILVDFILSKTLPSGVKLSDELSLKLFSPSDSVTQLTNSSNIAIILQLIDSGTQKILQK